MEKKGLDWEEHEIEKMEEEKEKKCQSDEGEAWGRRARRHKNEINKEKGIRIRGTRKKRVEIS